MVAKNCVHDDALIERPIAASVLTYAPKYVSPRFRDQPKLKSLIVFHELEDSIFAFAEESRLSLPGRE
jgi:hypothetical protein